MMKQIDAERRADMLRNVISEANEVGFRFPRMAVADLLLAGGGAPEVRTLLVRANEDQSRFAFPDDAVAEALGRKPKPAPEPEPDPATEAEKETRRKRTRKKAPKKSGDG